MLMSTVAIVTLKSYKQLDIVVDTFTVYFVRPLQMEDVIDIDVETVETGRTYNKVEISVYHEKELIAKGMLAAKVIRR